MSRSLDILNALIGTGERQQKLQKLTDRQVGQLMFDFVWDALDIASPEMAINIEATERLFRSKAGKRRDDEVLNDPSTLPDCPHCGSPMLHLIGLLGPDCRKCVAVDCGMSIEEGEQP